MAADHADTGGRSWLSSGTVRKREVFRGRGSRGPRGNGRFFVAADHADKRARRYAWAGLTLKELRVSPCSASSAAHNQVVASLRVFRVLRGPMKKGRSLRVFLRRPRPDEQAWLRRSETRPVRRSRSRPPEGRSFYAFMTRDPATLQLTPSVRVLQGEREPASPASALSQRRHDVSHEHDPHAGSPGRRPRGHGRSFVAADHAGQRGNARSFVAADHADHAETGGFS